MRSFTFGIPFGVAALVASFVFGSLACGDSNNASSSSSSGEASGDGGTVGPNGDGSSSSSSSGGSSSGDGGEEPTGDPAVQFIGRFDTRDAKGPQCSWPGCRILARFEGTQVSARLNEINEDWMDGAPSEWDVLVDGALQPKIVTTPGEKDYALASNLPAGKHVVELYKRSEAQNGTTQFIGFDFAGGTMLAPPNRKSRHVEIIGDSAPAGFGIEGVGQGPDCPGNDWAATWQNFHKSLGAVLAESLDAELFGTVYSGKGIAKNIWHPDNETMPIIFPRTNPNDSEALWDFSWIPDVVVIMMGGNDFAVGQPVDEGPATLEQFTNAYDGFIGTLRSKYGSAHIFLVVSPSVNDAEPAGRNSRTNVKNGVANVVQKRNGAGDAKVYSVEPPVAQQSELTGCNGHGNPAFHERVAADLAGTIKPKIGW